METTAGRPGQRAQAYAANNRLLAATHDAGWTYTEIAPVMGISPPAARQRAVSAEAAIGVEVPRPPDPEPEPPAIDRSIWLTAAEARALTRVSTATLSLWRRAGLLPSTIRKSKTYFWYSRADVERISSAPRHRKGGVDWSAVLDAIRREAASPGRDDAL